MSVFSIIVDHVRVQNLLGYVEIKIHSWSFEGSERGQEARHDQYHSINIASAMWTRSVDFTAPRF